MRLWDIRAGEEKAVLRGGYGSVLYCAFSPDESIIASAHGFVPVLWNAHTGEQKAILWGHSAFVLSCLFSPDGRTLASVGTDNTIRLWDALSGEPLLVFPCAGTVYACCYHLMGQMLAAGDEGGGIYLLEWIGREVKPIVVTAIEKGQHPAVRCPACQQEHRVSGEQLGGELICPTAGCGLRLKLNPFAIAPV